MNIVPFACFVILDYPWFAFIACCCLYEDTVVLRGRCLALGAMDSCMYIQTITTDLDQTACLGSVIGNLL